MLRTQDMAEGDQLSVDEVAVTRDTTKPPDYLSFCRMMGAACGKVARSYVC